MTTTSSHSLADALFTTTQQKVLGLLFGSLTEAFSSYTIEKFNRRRTRDNPFLTRVLEGPMIILSGSIDGD